MLSSIVLTFIILFIGLIIMYYSKETFEAMPAQTEKLSEKIKEKDPKNKKSTLIIDIIFVLLTTGLGSSGLNLGGRTSYELK